MTCNFDNPTLISAAKQERRYRAHNAKTEDEYLAAAESTWEEYMECDCEKCQSVNDAIMALYDNM